MTGEAKGGRIAIEQGPVRRRVTAMAGHAVAFTGRFMNAPNLRLLLSLFMAVQADFGRRLSQHADILAGMGVVARLAFTLFDRLMLRRVRDIVMTFQAEPTVKGQNPDRGALDLVTVVTVAVSHRRVDYLPEQSRITGTVLCVAVDAPGCDRVVLMGRFEPGTSRFMTGSTHVIAGHLQQSRMVCHVRAVTDETVIIHRCVDSGPGKRLLFVAVKAELFHSSIKELLMLRVVRFMTGIAFTVAHRFVDRFFAAGFLKP